MTRSKGIHHGFSEYNSRCFFFFFGHGRVNSQNNSLKLNSFPGFLENMRVTCVLLKEGRLCIMVLLISLAEQHGFA